MSEEQSDWQQAPELIDVLNRFLERLGDGQLRIIEDFEGQLTYIEGHERAADARIQSAPLHAPPGMTLTRYYAIQKAMSDRGWAKAPVGDPTLAPPDRTHGVRIRVGDREDVTGPGFRQAGPVGAVAVADDETLAVQGVGAIEVGRGTALLLAAFATGTASLADLGLGDAKLFLADGRANVRDEVVARISKIETVSDRDQTGRASGTRRSARSTQ